MSEQMRSGLRTRLETCEGLPSLPAFAMRILEIVNDPEVDAKKVAKVVSLDPAISSKILRMANSPFYAYRKKVETLDLAILILGLNATVSLALSFSLVKSFRGEKSNNLNHALYWRRTGLAAAASRALAKMCEMRDIEEIFTASLLQDIGMLAIDQLFPDFYSEADLDQACHPCVVSHEEKRLGVNHAIVGGWLLSSWNLPERLHLAVACSEDPHRCPRVDERAKFVRCVAFSGVLASLYLNRGEDRDLKEAAEKAESWLNVSPNTLTEILNQMSPFVTEVDHLFGLDILDKVDTGWVLERAREKLLYKTLEVCRHNNMLQETTVTLESRYEHLEENARLDGLTGVFNRAFLNESLEKAFHFASTNDEDLSIGFIDIDHFKRVNDTYGHAVGDQILKAIGGILNSQVRTTDVVGRYGGEEFLVILTDTNHDGAELALERILKAICSAQHDIGREQPLEVTVSIGFSTHSKDRPFEDAKDLVHAADQALYAAKANGRNCCVTPDLEVIR